MIIGDEGEDIENYQSNRWQERQNKNKSKEKEW